MRQQKIAFAGKYLEKNGKWICRLTRIPRARETQFLKFNVRFRQTVEVRTLVTRRSVALGKIEIQYLTVSGHDMTGNKAERYDLIMNSKPQLQGGAGQSPRRARNPLTTRRRGAVTLQDVLCNKLSLSAAAFCNSAIICAGLP
jgi:hypothetical protein